MHTNTLNFNEAQGAPGAKSEMYRWVGLVIQLITVFAVAYVFRIEYESGFAEMIPWIAGGVLLQFVFPPSIRRYFFVFLFIATCFLIMPWQSALVMSLFCSVCYGILLLPLLPQIVGLVLVFGFLFLTWYNVIPLPAWAYIFPFAGSIFMFRLFFYYYYRRTGFSGYTHIDRLAYFFQFINLFFLLYPIIDFKDFTHNYRNKISIALLNRAINYLWRGVVFILIYRWVYYYVYPDPVTVTHAFDVLFIVVATFLLLLRVVGMFYLVIGILCLFGYEMSDLFGNYYAAPNVPYAWRKINVYWQNFMLRIFYNPLYFYFRKKVKTEIRLVFISMLLAFFLSGWIHFYQNYFIQGRAFMQWHDILYWTIFGFLVFFHTRRVMRKGEKELSLFSWTLGCLVVFWIMAILYFLWNAESIREWWYFMKKLMVWNTSAIRLTGLLVGGLVLYFLVSFYIEKTLKAKKISMSVMNWIWFVIFLPLAGSWLISQRVSDEKNSFYFSEVASPSLMNKRDRKEIERGYYHKLLNNEQMRIRKWEIQRGNVNWNSKNRAMRYRNDVLYAELIPSFKTVFKGEQLHVNSLGLRDDEYTVEKPAGCIRIAMLGGSYEMGSGVGNDDDFETYLEKALTNHLGMKVEIWNFGIGGFHLIQSYYLADIRLPKYNFDYVIHVAHSSEEERLASDMSFFFRKKVDFKYPFIKRYVKASGATRSMCRAEIDHRMFKLRKKLTEELYQRFFAKVKAMKAQPLIIYLPALGDEYDTQSPQSVQKICAENRVPFLSMVEVYNGYTTQQLYLSPWDNHPNKKGHRIIGERLFQAIKSTNFIK